MSESLLKRIMNNRKSQHRWIALVLCLSMVVSLGTFASLHKTAEAQTYTKEVLDCPYAHDGASPVAHVHNDDCYDADRNLVCTLPEIAPHTHTEDCYTETRTLICGLEESDGHRHDDSCYTLERGDLICENTDEDHEHDDSCYSWNKVLSCGLAEGEGAHTHSDACYEVTRALTCGQEELPVHVHDANCIKTVELTKEEVEDKNAPTETKKPEATKKPEEEKDELPEMPVGDPVADLETAQDWERDFDDIQLTGNWAKDLAFIAATQQGKGESSRNFAAVLNDEGTDWLKNGWTRFGAWYGIPYGEWSAMFVSFCLHYAGIPTENVPYNHDPELLAQSFKNGNLFAGRDYVPAPGDLIFFDTDDTDNRDIDHMGIVYYVDEASGTLNTVEGDRSDAVETFGYSLYDDEIVGYGMLPGNPNAPAEEQPENPFIVMGEEEENQNNDENTDANGREAENAENGENTAPALPMPAVSLEGEAGGIQVVVEAPEGAFPEGVWMQVTPVNGNNLLDAVSAAVSGEVLEVQAVDIKFYDTDTNELEPLVPIRVTMTAARHANHNEAMQVVHVDGNSVEVIEQVQDAEPESAQDVVFDADSFSVYGIVFTVDFSYSVDGKVYDFSLPGGEKITLSELAEVLGMMQDTPFESAEAFIRHVSTVEFSDPQLVQVTQMENDWMLESLKAFDTEETLTITMDNGDVVTIRVTDESDEPAGTGGIQIQKIIVDASGNMINLPEDYTNSPSFNVYHSETAASADVKDLNVGSFTTDLTSYLAGYTKHDESTTIMPVEQINKTGWNEGLYINDLPYGMYYISENSTSIPDTITDANRTEWHYKNSYILTEYPWRNHNNDNYRHVSPTYTKASAEYAAVPEILGDHPGYSDGQTYSNDYLEFYVYNVYEAPQVELSVTKSWSGTAPDNWTATFRLQSRLQGETDYTDVRPVQTITLSNGEATKAFASVPRYEKGANGSMFPIEYTAVEESYSMTDATGTYTWDEINGYSTSDEDYHYYAIMGTATAPDDDGKSTIAVTNVPQNLGKKEHINVNLRKTWDSSFTTNSDSYATFALKRYIRTEYRDVSSADRTATPVTVSVTDGNSITVQPGVKLYLAGYFAPHDDSKSITFSASPAVMMADGSSASQITVTAAGRNAENAIVRSAAFTVTGDTTFTLTGGSENLSGSSIFILDTGNATSPVKDKSFSRTVTLNDANNWQTALSNLLSSETVSLDENTEIVYYYEYYFEETESSPRAYPSYSTGDIDHRIMANANVNVTNGPTNRLVVNKDWRGVPDTTGFPEVTFTLYVTNNENGNDGGTGGNGRTNYNKVYEGVVNGEAVRFEHIPLAGNNPTWICPIELPIKDTFGDTVYYYVQEDQTSGSAETGNIKTQWKFYYYRNSEGKQTNDKGFQAALTGDKVNGGSITICNKLETYRQMDIQKQFFEIGESGSIGNITAGNWSNTVLGFQVIRAIRTSDGKWIDEKGDLVDNPVWMDYGGELLGGYDASNQYVTDKGSEDFYFHNAGGNWHFRIEDNQGDQSNKYADGSGSGLPCYGFYLINGENIAVEYWYSFRETAVYNDKNRAEKTGWDWYSSITPVVAYGPPNSNLPLRNVETKDDSGNTQRVSAYAAFPYAYTGQDPMRIANFKASNLIVEKAWAEAQGAAEVYIKVYRTNGRETEDVTHIISQDIVRNNNWQGYVGDTSVMDTDHEWLILNRTNSWTATINRLLLEPIVGGGSYQYWMEEVAYKTFDGKIKYNPDSIFEPVYQKWEKDSGANGEWHNITKGDTIQLKSKGENKLKVINTASASSSYSVTKKYDGAQSATGGQSTVSGKYPTDGTAQVVLQLQQRYRYEKTENGVDYVSADNRTWVRADSNDAKTAWTVDWQNAESANPSVVTLPMPRPSTATLSDDAWYNSAAAWTYTWEGLDIEKNLGQPLPEGVRVQLYYRAVEVSTPGWFDPNSTIDGTSEEGVKAVDDSTQTASQIEAKSNEIKNIQGRTTLILNKQWTGLGEGKTWPKDYVVEYQLVQNYHLVSAEGSLNEDGVASAAYTPGTVFKSVDMSRANAAGTTSDMVHPQASGTLEENNHNLQLTGLPLYGFMTATADDVAAAAQNGVTLTVGKVYPVVYTYSVRETAVKKNGVAVPFKAQTVDAVRDENRNIYSATLTNELTSVTVRKDWSGLTPGSNESATIGLYRFEKESEPIPETTFQYTVNVTGSSDALNSDGTVTVRLYDSENREVGSYTLRKNDWSHKFNLEIGGTYHATFEGDGDVLNSAVTPATASNITEESSINLTATVKPVVTTTSATIRLVGTPSSPVLVYGICDNNGQKIKNSSGQELAWSPNSLSSAGTMTIDGLTVGETYKFYLQNGASSLQKIEGGTESYNWVTFTAQAGGNEIVLTAKESGGNTGSGDDGKIVLIHSGNGGEKWKEETFSPEQWVTIRFRLTNYRNNPVSFYKDNSQGEKLWDSNEHNQDTESDFSFDIQLPPNGTLTLYVKDDSWNVRNSGISITGKIAGARNLNFAPVRTISKAPAKAPASITWTNDKSTLPAGANPDSDTLVDTVTFSGSTWSKTWDELPKYSEDGKEYVYYAYETDFTGASGASTMTTSYSNEDGTLVVTNTPAYPELGSLKVQKEVHYSGALNTEANGQSFTVGLFTDANGTTRVTGIEDQTISITNGAGEATFSGLQPGTYYVFEVVNGTAVTASETKATIDGIEYTVTYSSANETTVSGGSTATFRLVNEKAPFALNILKVDANDHTKTLDGAKFAIQPVKDEIPATGRPSYTDGSSAEEKTTNSDGTLSFENLAAGYYEVKETHMPDGYVISGESSFYIHVDGDGISLVKVKTETDPEEGTIYTWEEGTTNSNVTLEATTATVQNTPGVALPQTGGVGTALFPAIGAALSGTAGAALMLKKRKEKE